MHASNRMGLYRFRYRVESQPPSDAVRASLEARLEVSVTTRDDQLGTHVEAPRIGGSATLTMEEGELFLEAGLPGNPVFLEQLSAALEDLGAVPLELSSGAERTRPTAPCRRWADQPWSLRARHSEAGRAAWATAYMAAQVLLIVGMPLWLVVWGFASLLKKARPA